MEPTKTMESLIKLLVASLGQCFKVFCQLPLEIGEIGHGAETAATDNLQFVGVISISGGCKGSVSVNLSSELARAAASALLGTDNVSQSDICDTVGEIANIIVGTAKTAGSSQGLDFDISCPTVLHSDSSLKVDVSPGNPVSHIAFKGNGFPGLIVAVFKP